MKLDAAVVLLPLCVYNSGLTCGGDNTQYNTHLGPHCETKVLFVSEQLEVMMRRNSQRRT